MFPDREGQVLISLLVLNGFDSPRKQQITWLQAWREDRALIAASDLISEALGQQFVNAVPLSMERVWDESATTRPVICLLSPGMCSRVSFLTADHT